MKYIDTIKDRLSMYSKVPLYPTISLHNNSSIHQESNCFIDVGMTYDISLQTMLAVAHSNPVISCNHDGLMQWLDKDCCYLVGSDEGRRDSNLVGNIPEIRSLSKTMKEAYKNREGFRDKQDMMLDEGHKSFYYTNKESLGDTICSLY